MDNITNELFKTIINHEKLLYLECDKFHHILSSNKRMINSNSMTHFDDLFEFKELTPNKGMLYELKHGHINNVYSTTRHYHNNSIIYIGVLTEVSDKMIIEQISKLNMEINNLSRDLIRKNRELKLKNDQITEVMMLDNLTQVYNRRYLHVVYDELNTSQSDFIIAIMDLDNFKDINDTYGHVKGDYVLKNFANIIKSKTRASDTIIRYGGDEFIILFNNVSKAVVLDRLEDIRISYEAFAHKEFGRKFSLSIGVSPSNRERELESIIKQADKALYKAKDSGKGQIHFNPLPCL